ncbi:hypothetical protein VTI74DRAFT_6560 [Chaetomium olivicolor]
MPISQNVKNTASPAGAAVMTHESFNASVYLHDLCLNLPRKRKPAKSIAAYAYAFPPLSIARTSPSEIPQLFLPNKLLNTAAGIATPHPRPQLRTDAHVTAVAALSSFVNPALTPGRRNVATIPFPRDATSCRHAHTSGCSTLHPAAQSSPSLQS